MVQGFHLPNTNMAMDNSSSPLVADAKPLNEFERERERERRMPHASHKYAAMAMTAPSSCARTRWPEPRI